MEWRTQQVPKADVITQNVAYYDFLGAIATNNPSIIENITLPDGNKPFSNAEASQIVQTLRNPSVRFQIERCDFEDVVSITLTRAFNEGGVVKYVTKNFSKLSLGQQQSILLSILLFSNRNCPLLIDQPEDNLDSEFIFKTLVKNLRKIKEHRQVIIVTHNANIAVLGDAELIIPLKSTSEKSIITDRGSIDNSETKKITCGILEGGEKAFTKRKEIYGF
jgi:ABC-type cobalamin/Fe3+-siderophores transport system ATPase subunit